MRTGCYRLDRGVSAHRFRRGAALAAIFAAACDGGGAIGPSANRAPEPVGSIPDLAVHAGDTATLDVAPRFADPDGDALTYGASSSNPSVAAVSVSGSSVAVAALATGSATITVSASDPGGLTAAQTFEATVPNRAPEPVGSIPDLAVHVGDTATLDVAPRFADPDGDALTYGASSSNPSVAAVSVSGSSVAVAALATGSATITVSASDPGGLTAAQTFEATVPNRAPEPVGSIPDLAVHVGDTATLDVAPRFADPDGDALTYGASSSNPSVAAVSVSGSSVAVAALATGSATITVSASDPGGLTAAQTFEATVPNRAPEPVGSIPDLAVHVGDTATLDVAPRFADPDGDALTYGASSSNPSVAAVSVSGSSVAVAALATGSATITVSASDPGGLTAAQTFEATVMAPGPDLTFTGVSPASATLAPGRSATFTFAIRNQGTIVSGATTIRAMRSPNPIISGRDTEIGAYPLAALGAKQERAFPLTISVDAGSAAGTVYIGMCVDAVTEESNTRNNCSDGARLTIAAPSAGRGLVAGDQSVIRIRAYASPTGGW